MDFLSFEPLAQNAIMLEADKKTINTRTKFSIYKHIEYTRM